MRAGALLLFVTAVSCSPDFDRSASLLAAPRLLAVRAEPPESAPGAEVAYTALVATPAGADDAASIDWSFCATPPALTESGAVSSACLAGEGEVVASGTKVSATTPIDACRRFGPLGMPVTSSTQVGQPVSPDETGGSTQPIRMAWDGGLAFAFERLTCDPRGVSMDVASAFRSARQANRNPHVASFTASPSSGPDVDLAVAWTADDIETYVMVDSTTASLAWRTERLWVAWFVTGGTLDHDANPATSTDLFAGNRWQAPATPGTYFLWAILHDDRGGLDFATLTVEVN
jgi:hypothetical protein